jgi:hypothetical protein
MNGVAARARRPVFVRALRAERATRACLVDDAAGGFDAARRYCIK